MTEEEGVETTEEEEGIEMEPNEEAVTSIEELEDDE